MIPLSDLTPHPQNAQLRTITPEALDGLKANILKGSTHVAREANDSETEILRLQESITINRNGNRILGGHRRIEALQSLGQTHLHPDDITWVEYDPDSPEEEEALIQLNNAEIQGTWNADPLRQRLTAIKQALAPGEYETTRLAELQAKLAELPKPPTQPGKDTPPPDLGTEGETYTPITQPGDLINLGPHRLLCGDATNEEDVARLMDGKQADLLITDPPYGVSYASKNEFLNTFGGNRNQTPMEGDHEAPAEMSRLWTTTFRHAYATLADDASYYITGPQGGDLLLLLLAIKEAGLQLKHMLVWNKNNHVLGRCDYNYKHEPILFGWKQTHHFYGQAEVSVWDIQRPHQSKLHPTMKPVELPERAIRNSSQPGQTILDPFLGSGTTLIACQNLDRTCYGIEISPQYCDVTIARFLKHTGPENHPDLAKKFAPLFS